MYKIIIDPSSYLDIVFKLATISIALFNAIFTIKIFWLKFQKDDAEKESDRKIQLLKSLILDHNFKDFYSIFNEIEIELLKLKQSQLPLDNKQAIDTCIGELFIKLRRNFYDSFLAVEVTLYEDIKSQCDELQSYFSHTIFDAGINLSHAPKYDELIYDILIVKKSEIIKVLFNYRG